MEDCSHKNWLEAKANLDLSTYEKFTGSEY